MARGRHPLISLVHLWRRACNRAFSLACQLSFQRYGRGTIIASTSTVWGERHIAIGSDCFIGPGSWLQVTHDPHRTSPDPVLEVGNRVAATSTLFISAAQKVTIEDSVLIARFVHISDHMHRFDAGDIPIRDQGITGIAPVRICAGAWLGQGVVVCPGVTIGRNAVIGANSVVRNDVPDFCIAAGAPARVIRRLDESKVST